MNRTTFDDMANDLDFDAPSVDTSDMAGIATPRLASVKAAPTEHHEPCGRCAGTGTYHGMSRYGSRCFACDGAGFKVFRTSAKQRAKARTQATERKARKAAESEADFAQAEPALHAWMTSKAGTFDFAASMLDAVRKYGWLTDAQRAAVERCMTRDAERDAARAAAAAARAAAPVQRLDALYEVMQRLAKIHAGDVTLARGRERQTVWIKHAAAEKALGKIEDGVLTMWTRPGVDQQPVRDLLAEFDAAPLQTAMRLGKATGRCCACARELTNPASIEAGIGPVCAEFF